MALFPPHRSYDPACDKNLFRLCSVDYKNTNNKFFCVDSSKRDRQRNERHQNSFFMRREMFSLCWASLSAEMRWEEGAAYMRESVYRISQPVDAYLYVALKRANTSFKLAEELRTRSPQEREPFWSIIRCFCARHDFEPLFGRVSLHHI